MTNFWDYTDQIQKLFEKYGLEAPKKGELDWGHRLYQLMETMDKIATERDRMLKQLGYGYNNHPSLRGSE
jgi:hypothetical protein